MNLRISGVCLLLFINAARISSTEPYGAGRFSFPEPMLQLRSLANPPDYICS
jgi:hypothetical protein